MPVPKSFKTCELYLTEEYAKDLDTKLQWSSIKDYAYIMHTKDVEPNIENNHFHVDLRFKGAIPTENICKHFGIQANMIEKIKDKFESAVAYLTHENVDKPKYPRENIKSNFDFNKAIDDALKYKDIYKRILDGSLRETDLLHLDNGLFYHKYKKRVDDAFDIRYRILKDEVLRMEKDIDVIFVDGDSRTGKTSYIVEQCQNLNVSYCKSSSSNDFLQDYTDEEVLILDDLRDDALKLADFLKFTDPHVRSTTQSRYRNKCFVGSLIYITTTKPMEKWYENCKEEQRLQFTSRITTHMHFTKDDIEVYNHEDNNDTLPFILTMTVPNLMKDKYKDARGYSNQITKELLNALLAQPSIENKNDGFIDANGGVVPFD